METTTEKAESLCLLNSHAPWWLHKADEIVTLTNRESIIERAFMAKAHLHHALYPVDELCIECGNSLEVCDCDHDEISIYDEETRANGYHW